MKTLLKVMGITALSMYIIVSFISFMPNPSDWGIAGRASFLFFLGVFSITGALIIDDFKRKK